MSTALAERPAVLPASPAVTPDQLDLIRRTIAKDATPDELKLYLYDCARQGVHPLDKLIHFTKRSGKYTPITSIDFMRIRAAETGEYAGSDDAVFGMTNSTPPDFATVTVWRLVQGQRCSFTATARWSEYKPEQNDFMWKKMPHTMLGKCAEALALRKGFPRQLAGLYAKEEMDQADTNTCTSEAGSGQNNSHRGSVGTVESHATAQVSSDAISVSQRTVSPLDGPVVEQNDINGTWSSPQSQHHASTVDSRSRQQSWSSTTSGELSVSNSDAQSHAQTKKSEQKSLSVKSGAQTATSYATTTNVNESDSVSWPEPPPGFFYVQGYQFNDPWHEAYLLRYDSQGGALKVSTKQKIGSKLKTAQDTGIPVQVDVTMKARAKGEAYVNAVTLLTPPEMAF